MFTLYSNSVFIRPYALMVALTFSLTGMTMGQEAIPNKEKVYFEGAIPTPEKSGIKEVQAKGLHDLPIPDQSQTTFSRHPRAPHVDTQTGILSIEYVLPPLKIENGVSPFYIEQHELSADGKQLTVTRSRIYAPSKELSVYSFAHSYQSSQPLIFKVGSKLILYKREQSLITSCEVFELQKGESRPVLLRKVFPNNRWQYGLFSF